MSLVSINLPDVRPFFKTAVWTAFVERLPKLRLLSVSNTDRIFDLCKDRLRGLPSRPTSTLPLEATISDVSAALPQRLVDVLCCDEGSVSALAFTKFHSWRAMELITAAGWPFQVAGTNSLLGMALWGHLTGRIPSADINRTIQPFLQRPEIVDLRAVAPNKDLNCAQLALLTGDAHIVNSVLSLSAQIVDRDLQLLVSSGGKVNMFHAAVESLKRNAVLPAFKLFFSRQKSLGLYPSLCYEEQGDLGLTVLEALLVKRLHEPLFYLLEKGIEFGSPLPRPQSRALPSVLHAAFYDMSRHEHDAEFFKAMESMFVSRREMMSTDLLDTPYGKIAGRPSRSVLAAIVRGQNHAILTKALLLASEKQKNIALKELSMGRPFYEAQERALMVSGANPHAEQDEHGDMPIIEAAKCIGGERIQLMITVKGGSMATAVDARGNFLAGILADCVLAHKGQLPDPQHIVPAMKALLEPAAVKKSKSTLQKVQAMCTRTYTYSWVDEMRVFVAAATKLNEHVTLLLKSAQ
jgi:hypothetical protein